MDFVAAQAEVGRGWNPNVVVPNLGRQSFSAAMPRNLSALLRSVGRSPQIWVQRQAGVGPNLDRPSNGGRTIQIWGLIKSAFWNGKSGVG